MVTPDSDFFSASVCDAPGWWKTGDEFSYGMVAQKVIHPLQGLPVPVWYSVEPAGQTRLVTMGPCGRGIVSDQNNYGNWFKKHDSSAGVTAILVFCRRQGAGLQMADDQGGHVFPAKKYG